MLTTLHTRLKRASRWLPALLLPFAAQAQVPLYNPANAANVAGTFTSIGTTGTAIATANTDDANSAATPIGFTFNFNGAAFTSFVLNTNGFIRLGSAAPSSAALFYTAPQAATAGPIASTDPADVNLIMPFAVDLTAGTAGGAGYQVATSGAAGSRVTTIQWSNVQDKANTIDTQLLNFSFQVKLYENGQIEFVYGPTTPNTTGNNFRTIAVGIKGSSAAASLTVTKGSTQLWSAATFASGDYTGNTHNVRQTAPADAGRTYRFVPTVQLNNDAAVTALYTLGKVSSSFGSPVTSQVVVTNLGSTAQTNLPVTFTVSGATTFTSTQTIASLASGVSTTLTFTYPVTGTTGTNTVVASVPNTDDLATNNSQTYSQAVTATSLAYIDGSQPLFATGVGVGLANGVLAARYTLTQATVVSSITPTFVGAGTANTTYQVQLYDATGTGGTPGAVLFTSPTQTRPGATGPVTIPVPNIAVAAGNFFVAIKELDNNVGLAYQVEDPLRPSTFYFQAPPGGFTLVNTTTLRTRLALEVGLGAPTCAAVTGLTVGNITTTGATVTFTGSASGTSYTVTYTPTGGTATTVTPTPTASPVTLSGLTAGTTYTVSVTTNCAAGQTSSTATTTFTTTAVTSGYCATALGGVCGNNDVTAVSIASTTFNATGLTCTTTPNGAYTAYAATGANTATLNRGASYQFTVAVATGSSVSVWVDYNNNLVFEPSEYTSLTANSATPTVSASISIPANAVAGQTGVRVRSRANGNPNGSTDACTSFGSGETKDFVITLGAVVACPSVSALAVGNITTTGATVTFTGSASGTSYTVTYTPTGGTATTVTPTPTASPVTLSGLTAGTTYTVSVTTNCAAGQTSSAVTTTFTTATAPPAYVTLPYSESFEGPWLSAASTRDIPTASWRNTPATGNASWRRVDDGASAAWTGAGSGAYTPVSSLGLYSARFHSYFSPNAAVGTLDLYVNMSTLGTKTLNFDYINPTGTDVLDVLVSTDGGTTFSATPVLTATVNAAFAPKTVVIASNSATTIVRFRATSDFGNDDIGIDNLRLTVLTATTNAALAATVNLYPNPAHQSFQLAVPTGLRSASATLSNTLGQVVQSRQLNLPAAGGTADFNVSSLAPGVYTLTLKSGADLVVKRVVVE